MIELLAGGGIALFSGLLGYALGHDQIVTALLTIGFLPKEKHD